MAVVLVVDVANVMGSRPDGWWKDRAGAATRLLGELAGVREVDGEQVTRIVAVVEGRARDVPAPDGVEVVRAPRDGDTTIAEVTAALVEAGETPLVATADRGLRDRLAAGARVTGPGRLLSALG